MARDKHGVTLREGDPVAYGDARAILGTIRVAAVHQEYVTVDWAPPHEKRDPSMLSSLLEKWDADAQRRWAEARAADAGAEEEPEEEAPPRADEPVSKPPGARTKHNKHAKHK